MYPRHLRGFDYLGLHRYFLTFCTFARAPLFVDGDRVDLVLAQILRAARADVFVVLAYCFMPDHAHLLVEGRSEASDCLRFIRTAKQLSGYHFEQGVGRRLWQRYGYERTLRDDDDSLRVARYILENPIRAGLATRVADYPFLGSEVYALDEILEAVQLDEASFRRRSG